MERPLVTKLLFNSREIRPENRENTVTYCSYVCMQQKVVGSWCRGVWGHDSSDVYVALHLEFTAVRRAVLYHFVAPHVAHWLLLYTALQAVINAEAKPFLEARTELPALKAATRWVAVEASWGHARALASELSRIKGNDAGLPSEQSSTGSGTSSMATDEASDREDLEQRCVAGGARRKGGGTDARAQAAVGGGNPEVYCLCRAGDNGGVMVCCDDCSEWFHISW